MPAHSPPAAEGEEDMAQMDDLTGEAILDNVQRRYLHDAIYTNVASILIAVNPYHALPELYNDATLRRYHSLPPDAPPPPPHIFSIARSAYLRALGRDPAAGPTSQSILISGESGAGKTEATKHILTYLVYASSASPASAQHLPSSASPSTLGAAAFQQAAASSLTRHIEQRLLNANPVLEAFGNAKTLRNDNSSRFGKWVTVHVDVATGRIVAGSVQHYLLESSRVVGQGQGERSFNIFYHLLAHCRQPPSAFRYLSGSGCDTVAGLDERAMYDGVVRALDVIGLTAAQQQQVMDVVLGILHLGNINFTATPLQSGKEGSAIAADSTESLKEAARQFRLKPQALSAALTAKVMVSPRSTIINMPRSVKEAEDTRDSMAKAVYSRLMTYLIARINASLSPSPSPLSPSSHASPAQTVRIGLLDIFGFEVFPSNSLEQLLINYANERLHQHFLHHVFKLEQELYAAEGIALSSGITFQDNQPVLDVLDKKPAGVLPLLHDELFVPRGSDEALLVKLHAAHGGIAHYIRPRIEGSGVFGIAHYAGAVEYGVTGMVDKNRSKVGEQIVAVFAAAEGEVIRDMFGAEEDGEEDGSEAVPAAVIAAAAGKVGRPSAVNQPAVTQSQQGRAVSASLASASSSRSSISSLFLQSMSDLLTTIASTESHFVRCIKPNSIKASYTADTPLLMTQLSSSGVIDAVRVRRDGYSERMPIPVFLARYSFLAAQSLRARGMERSSDRDKVDLVMEAALSSRNDSTSAVKANPKAKQAKGSSALQDGAAAGGYQIGRSKVFYKAHLHVGLETAYQQRRAAAAIVLQKRIRGWLVRRRQRAVRQLWKDITTALQTGALPALDKLLSSSAAASSLPPALLSTAQQKRGALAAGCRACDALLQSLSLPAASLADRLRLLDTAIDMAANVGAPLYPTWYPQLRRLQAAAAEVRTVLGKVQQGMTELDEAACDDESTPSRVEQLLQQSSAAIAAAVQPLSSSIPVSGLSSLSGLTEVAATRSAVLRLQRVAQELRRGIDSRELAEVKRALQDGDREGLRWPVMREGRVCHQALSIATEVDAAVEAWTEAAITGIIASLSSLLPKAPSSSAALTSPLDEYFPAGVSVSSLLALLDASLIALRSEVEAQTAAQSALHRKDHFKLTMAIQRAEDALYMKEHSRRTVKGAKIETTSPPSSAPASPRGRKLRQQPVQQPRDLQELVVAMKVECSKLERLAMETKRREARIAAATDALKAVQGTEDADAIDAAIRKAEAVGVGKDMLDHARSRALTIRTIALLGAAIESRRVEGRAGLQEAVDVSSGRLRDQLLDVRSREYQDRHQQAQAVMDMLLAVDRVKQLEQDALKVQQARQQRGKARQAPPAAEEEAKEEDEWRVAVDAVREVIAASRLFGAKDADVASALSLIHDYDALHPRGHDEKEAEERLQRERDEQDKAREKQRIIDRLRPQLNGGVRVMLPVTAPPPHAHTAHDEAKAPDDKASKRIEDKAAVVVSPPGGPSAVMQHDGSGEDARRSSGSGSGGGSHEFQPPARDGTDGLERVVRISAAEWTFDVNELENDTTAARLSLAQVVQQQGGAAAQPKVVQRDGEMIAPKNSSTARQPSSCCCCCVIS